MIFLAPMAGITDPPFRLLCFENGCGMAFTEMISAKGFVYGSEATRQMLEIFPGEGPLGVQLFGREPDILSEAASAMAGFGFSRIDINMGCPAPKIVKNGEGSALMNEPELAGRIIRAVSDATPLPVTVKIRKGFGGGRGNAVEIAKIAEANGCAGVTVHGRTREQYYSGKADWGIIRAVKDAVKIQVIGNGDVNSPEAARAMLDETGCDGVMVARAALGNPWIFGRIARFLETGELLPEPGVGEKIATALRHCEMLEKHKGHIGILEMRKHLSWYIKGLPGAAEARVRINSAGTIEEMGAILQTIAHNCMCTGSWIKNEPGT
ncbi:MAG: tRNA dihydrouridine synthase DusB [Defluviitaleaceae bacterium]|nr:tRNA dihydrouridine synthase DusB [Defluviitaleaceae bacterium]